MLRTRSQRRARGADVARVDRDEMHVWAEPPGEPVAAVAAGVKDDDRQHRHGQEQRRCRQRAQAARQMLEFVVRGARPRPAWSNSVMRV